MQQQDPGLGLLIPIVSALVAIFMWLFPEEKDKK